MAIKRFSFYPLGLLLALIILFLFSEKYILINMSSSSKLGIYFIEPTDSLKRNDIVAVCLAEPYKSLGISRNYLTKGRRCDGSSPVVKTLVGMPGDTIIITENEININEKHFSIPCDYFDSEHRKLTPWPQGIYRQTKGYWLLGENNIKSWDSRYWGDVTSSQILYKLKPLLTF